MTGCSYNKNDRCHAMAVTIGGPAPVCDTYLDSAAKGGVPDITGGVGACKIDDCMFNELLECLAKGINVGRHADHAECNTFAPIQ